MSILRIKGKIVGTDKEAVEARKAEEKPTNKPQNTSKKKTKKPTTTKDKE